MPTKLLKPFGALALIGALCWMTSCQPSDAKITQEITTKIGAVAPGVSVSVQQGVATLTGEVTDEATRANLDSLVKSVKGVKSVQDNLSVPPPPAPVVINPDYMVKASIDSALGAKQLSGITVTVSEGVVTLTGDVKRSDLQTVMQIANESRPKRVVNQLNIK